MPVNTPKRNYKNPVACASAFGRFFYAVDSLVYYSQVLVSPNDTGRCYQSNDPTSSELPDLLATDGGVVELEDSRSIKAMKSFRSGVLIFAGNGVWYISNPDGGFTATAFNVEKISDRGIESTKSIVEGQNAIYYFSNNGIMMLTANEFNNLQVEDISEDTIRSYFLSDLAGKKAEGVYDEGRKQCVWWLPQTAGKGLILDTRLGAFYPQGMASTTTYLKSPFSIENAIYYPSAEQNVANTSLLYNFSNTTNRTFQDFGTTQDAYLVTGFETLGKFSNKKGINQTKVFFRKTETVITGHIDNSYTYDFPSGCLFQARWDFDNTDAFNKFTGILPNDGKGKVMQLYKPMQRGFIPDAYPYTFNTGESILSNKFTVRGNGDAVQFVFQTEAGKDLQLLGYSVNFTMRGKM
jgi:hypothetical protein